MGKILNLKPKEIETFSKIINEYIALQTSSSLSTLLSEPINYKVMILDKRFFNPKNIKLSSDEFQMCGVRLIVRNSERGLRRGRTTGCNGSKSPAPIPNRVPLLAQSLQVLRLWRQPGQ